MSQATDYAGVEEAAGFQPSGVSLSRAGVRKLRCPAKHGTPRTCVNDQTVSNPIAEARGLPQASAKTCICWVYSPGWHVHSADQLTRASGKRYR